MISRVLTAAFGEGVRIVRKNCPLVLRDLLGIFVVGIDHNRATAILVVAGAVSVTVAAAAAPPRFFLVDFVGVLLGFGSLAGEARAAALVVSNNHSCSGKVREELDVRVNVNAETIQIEIRTRRRTS